MRGTRVYISIYLTCYWVEKFKLRRLKKLVSIQISHHSGWILLIKKHTPKLCLEIYKLIQIINKYSPFWYRSVKKKTLTEIPFWKVYYVLQMGRVLRQGAYFPYYWKVVRGRLLWRRRLLQCLRYNRTASKSK